MHNEQNILEAIKKNTAEKDVEILGGRPNWKILELDREVEELAMRRDSSSGRINKISETWLDLVSTGIKWETYNYLYHIQ